MKKSVITLALIGVIILVSGCGYHMGSIAHPQLTSIAIAPVVNETTSFNVASDMRMGLCEMFMTDGSLTLTNLNKADCILQSRVISVDYIEVTSDSYDYDVIYRPTEWRVTVKVEFSVIIPGKREPLISAQTASGSALFQVQADLETNRRQATLQACADAARRVVTRTTEAW